MRLSLRLKGAFTSGLGLWKARPAGSAFASKFPTLAGGIPKGQEETIFKAFQQADGAMNRTHEGTGLGLSITKSLVELMGGRIWVELKEDPGNAGKLVVHLFCLPRATKHAVNSHMEKSRTVTQGARAEARYANPNR